MTSSQEQLTDVDYAQVYRRFVASVPSLVQTARLAAENMAFSYRLFLVGCSGLFLDSEGGIETLSQGNLKNEIKTKVCAEKKVLNSARRLGLVQAVGLVVAATTDIDKIAEVTDLPTPTLHSCGDCLNLFVGHPLMRRETLIVTVGDKDDAYQVMTSGEMRDLYTLDPEAVLEQPKSWGFDDWDAHLAGYDRLIQANLGLNRVGDIANFAQRALLQAPRNH